MNALFRSFLTLARGRPVVVASLAIFILLGVVNYFLWQRHGELAEHSRRIKSEGEAMRIAIAGHSRIAAELALAQEALAYIEANLISEPDLAGNLDYFYRMEKQEHIRLSNLNQLSSLPVSEDHPYKAVPFTFHLTSAYSQVLASIHQLETGPRILIIKNYRFSQANAAADSIGLDLTVEMLSRP